MSSSPPPEDNEQELAQPFRFLDLPAELRTRVYHTVLHSEPITKKSEILPIFRVCKLIRRELKGFLEDEDTVTVTAAFHSFMHYHNYRHFGAPQIYCNTTVTGKDVDYLHLGPSSVTAFSTMWPRRMLDVENINLSIYLSDGKPRSYMDGSDFFPLNHLLSGMNTFLRKSKRADQKLRIKFSSNVCIQKVLPPEIIYPISKLSFDLDLELFGLDDEVEQAIMEKRFSPEKHVQRDVVEEWMQCRHGIYTQLIRATTGKPTPTSANAASALRIFRKYDVGLDRNNFQIYEKSDKEMAEILDVVKATAEETASEHVE